MVIIETALFTKRVVELVSENDYRDFQLELIQNPEMGRVIPGTAGLRKVRIAAKGHGKRGGARIIYYFANSLDQILMLYIFPKGDQSDLTSDQKKVLKNIVTDEYR